MQAQLDGNAVDTVEDAAPSPQLTSLFSATPSACDAQPNAPVTSSSENAAGCSVRWALQTTSAQHRVDDVSICDAPDPSSAGDYFNLPFSRGSANVSFHVHVAASQSSSPLIMRSFSSPLNASGASSRSSSPAPLPGGHLMHCSSKNGAHGSPGTTRLMTCSSTGSHGAVPHPPNPSATKQQHQHPQQQQHQHPQQQQHQHPQQQQHQHPQQQQHQHPQQQQHQHPQQQQHQAHQQVTAGSVRPMRISVSGAVGGQVPQRGSSAPSASGPAGARPATARPSADRSRYIICDPAPAQPPEAEPVAPSLIKPYGFLPAQPAAAPLRPKWPTARLVSARRSAASAFASFGAAPSSAIRTASVPRPAAGAAAAGYPQPPPDPHQPHPPQAIPQSNADTGIQYTASAPSTSSTTSPQRRFLSSRTQRLMDNMQKLNRGNTTNPPINERISRLFEEVLPPPSATTMALQQGVVSPMAPPPPPPPPPEESAVLLERALQQRLSANAQRSSLLMCVGGGSGGGAERWQLGPPAPAPAAVPDRKGGSISSGGGTAWVAAAAARGQEGSESGAGAGADRFNGAASSGGGSGGGSFSGGASVPEGPARVLASLAAEGRSAQAAHWGHAAGGQPTVIGGGGGSGGSSGSSWVSSGLSYANGDAPLPPPPVTAPPPPVTAPPPPMTAPPPPMMMAPPPAVWQVWAEALHLQGVSYKASKAACRAIATPRRPGIHLRAHVAGSEEL